MAGANAQQSRICVIGDNSEAEALSAILAIRGISNVRIGFGRTYQTLFLRQDRPVDFTALSASGLIKREPSIGNIAIPTVSIFIVTSHATSSEMLRHEAFLKRIGTEITQGSWVIYTGLCPSGYTKKKLGSIIETFSGLKIGQEIGLAYMPFTYNNEPLNIVTERPQVLATINGPPPPPHVQEMIFQIFPSVRIIEDVRIAETAALYRAASQEVAQALQLELALLANQDDTDFPKVLQLIQSLGDNVMDPSSVRQGLVNGSIASTILSEHLHTRVIQTAMRVNNQLQDEVVKLVKKACQKTGQSLRRSRIAIIGSEWFSTTMEGPSREMPEIAKVLAKKCANVTLYAHGSRDWKPNASGDKNLRVETDPMRALSNANCALVALLPTHVTSKLDPHRMALEMARPATICDLTGVMIPSNVEQAGLFYTSLGRGSPIT